MPLRDRVTRGERVLPQRGEFVPASPKNFTRPLRYRIDRWIRQLVMRVIGRCAPRSDEVNADLLKSASIKKILLIRANFRMGNTVLALPAIAGFRKHFPEARIDFVGSPISDLLFRHQPLNHHYTAPRRFPRVLWQYPQLIRLLRANRYDVAVDVSCSQSGVGAFIVGFSGARIRVGLAGKWDRLFNLKISRLNAGNKYLKLTEFLAAMRLEVTEPVGSLEFSPVEKAEGLSKLESFMGNTKGKKVGVFLGARKLRGKRWPVENFKELIYGLDHRGFNVVAFLGPEENDIADPLKVSLGPRIPVIYEPSVRKFAALIAPLDLLICCDSGPMHLACSVGVPVLAIFQERDVARWAPPATTARVVYGANGVGALEVLDAALDELSRNRLTNALPAAPETISASSHG